MTSIKKHLDVPPVWMVFSLIIVYVLNKIVPIFDFGRYLSDWIPYLLVIVAVVYIGLAIKKFRTFNTPVVPRKRPTALITDGVYSVSRNPIYTGFALIILAFVIAQGDLIGVLALGFFVWIITKRFIIREEAVVLETFPEAKEWFERTNRW